ncbi:hypothetical protein [Leifsonia sp. AG29]|uniref:hypothetical protein n=1 Tax=Leifsonia sp. AG29 TaxID=2598860 RepID=UPI001E31AAE3|nr:hypothetical protein [Leifsonia sp. AG29]
MNTIKLDLEVTREELATTLDDLFAWFNIRLQVRTHPVFFAGAALAVAGAAAGIVALVTRKRRA